MPRIEKNICERKVHIDNLYFDQEISITFRYAINYVAFTGFVAFIYKHLLANRFTLNGIKFSFYIYRLLW